MTDFAELPDLASERLGGAVLAANDEFFAPKEALLKPGPAEWREGEYTDSDVGADDTDPPEGSYTDKDVPGAGR